MIWRKKIFGLLIILTGFVFAACTAGVESPEPTPSTQPTGTSVPEFSRQQEILAIWRRGPHSKISFKSEFAQPYCAKCHSPQDWDPAVNPDEAFACASAIVNLKNGVTGEHNNQFYDIATWHAIGCKTCHLIDVNGDINRDTVWIDQETGKVETISKSINLCTKCHTQTHDIDHSVDLGNDGLHSTFDCILCHDPHKTTATCSNGGCHKNVANDLTLLKDLVVEPGHETETAHNCAGCHFLATQVAEEGQLTHIGVQHSHLSCAACHDGSGMEVGPVENSNTWTTLQSVEWEGMTAKKAKFSHIITKEVDCTRCHFKGNPWELKTDVGVDVHSSSN
jgi:hypothetical protein